MTKKKEFLIFDVFSGQFEEEFPEEIDFTEYMQIVEAERKIATKMIKQRLDKIDPKDFKESKD